MLLATIQLGIAIFTYRILTDGAIVGLSEKGLRERFGWPHPQVHIGNKNAALAHLHKYLAE